MYHDELMIGERSSIASKYYSRLMPEIIFEKTISIWLGHPKSNHQPKFIEHLLIICELF
jgi:hypothetical protein